MRAVWVDQGSNPAWDKLKANGITWVYVSLLDPNAGRILEDIRGRGYKGGVYAAWNWFPGLTGAQFAQEVHSRLRSVFPAATNTFPKVSLDDETHDPARITAMLKRWRELRPNTDTSWTFESFQGGWMDSEFVGNVVNAKVRLVPQCYTGNMVPVDSLACARDLTKRGYPDALISPFHDAAKLPAYWDGFAFTQGRLP